MSVSEAEFQARRNSGVGGSDVGIIMGVNKWKTPVQLWMEKTGRKEGDPMNNAMYWGTVFEDVVAREYSKQTGNKVVRVNKLLRHPSYSFMIGNIDRAVLQGNSKTVSFNQKLGKLTTNRILECKTANGYNTEAWGEEGSDVVPPSYLCQVQWYMGITDVPVCDIAVLIGGQDYRIYTIERDKELIDAMISKAADFWKLVETDTAPEPTTPDEAKELFPTATSGKIIEVGTNALHLIDDIKNLEAKVDALESEIKPKKAQLMALFGDGDELQFDGKKIATWKNQSRTSLDQTRLKAEHPELFTAYQKVSQSRTLRLSK